LRKLIALGLLGTAVMVLYVLSAAAANTPVKLDPSFGLGGRSLLDVAGGAWEDEPFTLIQQPDGKLAMPGKAHGNTTDFDFAVIRLNENGTRDKSFSGDGVVTIDIFGGYDEALGIVRQADGKLVVAGFGRNPATGLEDFALARVNSDGTLDTTFGGDGVVTTDFFAGNDRAMGLVIQPDGKLVAGGYARDPATDLDFALARYDSGGSLDITFDGDGKATTDFTGSADAIQRMTTQPDGKFVAVGVTLNTYLGNQDFAIARYNTNGSLDAGFATYGKAGVASTDFLGNADSALSVLVAPDGKILAGGLVFNPQNNSYDMGLARYNADGNLDTSFGTYGKPGLVTVDYFRLYDQILALALQPDGKIFAAGHAKHPQRSFEFALARFNADGTRDATFGYGGVVTTDFSGGPDGIHGLVLRTDGKAVVTGDSYNPRTGGDDFALARYLVADPSWITGVVNGLPDSAFSADGRASTTSSLASIEADITAGSLSSAVSKLNVLKARLNGCGASADADDWITACQPQLQVRGLVDQVINKLGG
jgi:uncharacterized delta-60 repeat protein